LQLRGDTAANWTSVNPTLLANELGRETDTGKIKIGDGSTAWTSLAYQAWATLPLAVASGGTGQTTYTNGQLLIGNTTGNTLTKATLTAGSGIAVTNGTGSITVAASEIADSNISATAEIAVSKLADGAARQLLQTDSAGTGVEWTSNVDIPGTLDVTGATVFDSTAAHPLGTAGAPTITFTGDTNTGIYSPGADEVAISTNGTGRLVVDANGRIGVGQFVWTAYGAGGVSMGIKQYSADITQGLVVESSASGNSIAIGHNGTVAGISAYYGASGSYTPLAFFTSNTERMRLDSSGRLGLGSSSPQGTIHVKHATDANIFFRNGTAAGLSTGTIAECFNDAVNATTPFYLRASSFQFGTDSGGTFVPRVTVTSGGAVGIGITSPAATAHCAGSFFSTSRSVPTSGVGPELCYDTGDSKSILLSYNRTSSAYVPISIGGSQVELATSGTERARIDSSGRLLVGTSSSVAVDSAGTTFNSELQVAGSSASVTIARSIGPGNLFLARNQTVNDGSPLGVIGFQGGDGTNLIQAASIQGVVDGTPGANDMPGRLVFSVTADGASSPTEAMRIKNTRVINFSNAPVYADNAAAKTGGLVDGDVYRTSTGDLKIVYT
jgi:hypothetical protein